MNTRLRAPLALALVAMAVFGATTAFASIGDPGVVQACYDSGGNVKITPALPCPKGYTSLGQIYTKAGADAAFLTQTAAGDSYLAKTGTAADSDKLDGKDSSDFLPSTNCVGYPHLGIDWHGCDLNNANLNGAGLFQANLQGAKLFGGRLVEASLGSATLRDADLRFANLRSAIMFGADMSGADLRGANLLDASMGGVTLTGVEWGATTCPDGTSSDANGDTCVGHL